MNRTSKRLHSGLAIAACLLFSSASVARPAHVILIRHAEKPPDDGDNHLSLKGRERAAALAPYFREADELPKISNLAAIYAQKPPHPDKSSLRPIETIQPLADSMKLKVLTPFERDQVKQLVKEIMTSPKYEGKTVIICWEHKVLVDIANSGISAGESPYEVPGRSV